MHSRSTREVVVEDRSTRMVLPNSPLADLIQPYVGPTAKIAVMSGTNIGDLVTFKLPPHLMPESDVYSSPCSVCDKS